MASLEHQKSLEEMVTCPICMEWMKDPKHLHCQHAFCTDCLKDWVSQPGNSQRSVSCPVCREHTPIPSGGILQLPVDFNTNRLLDLLRAQMEKTDGQMSSTGKVTKCSSDGRPAVAFCSDCQDHLCLRCVALHSKEPAFAIHRIETFSKAKNLGSTNPRCMKHTNKSLGFYCIPCQQMVCPVCMRKDHTGHEIKPISAHASFQRKVIREMCKNLQSKLVEFKEKTIGTTSEKASLFFDVLRGQVDTHAACCKHSIDQWQSSLLNEIDSTRQALMFQISEREDLLAASESLLCYCDSLLQNSSQHQVVIAYPDTRQRLVQLQEQLHNVGTSTNTAEHQDVINQKFIPKPCPQTFGRLAGQDSEEDVTERLEPPGLNESFPSLSTSDGGACSPPQTSRSSLLDLTRGETCWQQPSPILSTWEKTRFDLDVQDVAYVSMTQRKEMHDRKRDSTSWSQFAVGLVQWAKGQTDDDIICPLDVQFLSSKSNSYDCHLYVAKRGWWSVGNVWRYTVNNYSGMSDPGTRVMGNFKPDCITVAPDNTLMATEGSTVWVNLQGTIPNLEQNTAGLAISLPTLKSVGGIDVSRDNHLVCVNAEQSVVAIHKIQSPSFKVMHICTIGSHGKEAGQFNRPLFVCCDSMRDRFIVSDSGNHRIQVFKFTGEFLWEAGSNGSGDGELCRPMGVCVDEAGNILVADSGNSRITVFGWPRGHWVRHLITADDRLLKPYSLSLTVRNSRIFWLAVTELNGKMPSVSIWKLSDS